MTSERSEERRKPEVVVDGYILRLVTDFHVSGNPDDMPCTESYTFEYTLAEGCGSYEECHIAVDRSPTPDRPNRGYGYHCECQSQGLDAGMEPDAGGWDFETLYGRVRDELHPLQLFEKPLTDGA